METQPQTTNSQETIFKELQNYDWEHDREFQGGLSAILGPSPSPSQSQELTLRAQCFYYARKKGTPVDFDAYKAYLSSQISSPIKASSPFSAPVPHSETPQPQSQPPAPGPTLADELGLEPRATPIPTTYRTSRDLFSSSTPSSSSPFGSSQPAANSVPSSTTKSTSFQPSSDPKSAPYPASFAEIVTLIQSGEPIPGVVDVDPTVAWGQGSKPAMKARRKPYEMHLTEDQVQPGYWGGTFGSTRNPAPIEQELPDGEEPAFKGANWWRVMEAREQGNGKDETTSAS